MLIKLNASYINNFQMNLIYQNILTLKYQNYMNNLLEKLKKDEANKT